MRRTLSQQHDEQQGGQRQQAKHPEVGPPGVEDGAAAPAVGGPEAAPGPTLMALPKHINTILILTTPDNTKSHQVKIPKRTQFRSTRDKIASMDDSPKLI